MVAFERSLHEARALLEEGQYTKAVEGFMAAAAVHGGNCPECTLGQAEAWAGLRWYGVASMECDECFKFNSPDKDLNARAHALKGEALVNTVEPKAESQTRQRRGTETSRAVNTNLQLID